MANSNTAKPIPTDGALLDVNQKRLGHIDRSPQEITG
jgi:hypothetical protein